MNANYRIANINIRENWTTQRCHRKCDKLKNSIQSAVIKLMNEWKKCDKLISMTLLVSLGLELIHYSLMIGPRWKYCHTRDALIPNFHF